MVQIGSKTQEINRAVCTASRTHRTIAERRFEDFIHRRAWICKLILWVKTGHNTELERKSKTLAYISKFTLAASLI
jgi:hypothetical protein